MKLDQLGYSINAKRYGITEEELEGLKLEEQAEIVIDRIQDYIDEQVEEKKKFDEERRQHLIAADSARIKRSKAKGRADQARSQLTTFRKDFNERIDLINYKASK